MGAPKFHQHTDALIKLQEEGASKAEMKRQTGLAYNKVTSYLKRLGEEA